MKLIGLVAKWILLAIAQFNFHRLFDESIQCFSGLFEKRPWILCILDIYQPKNPNRWKLIKLSNVVKRKKSEPSNGVFYWIDKIPKPYRHIAHKSNICNDICINGNATSHLVAIIEEKKRNWIAFDLLLYRMKLLAPYQVYPNRNCICAWYANNLNSAWIVCRNNIKL